MTDPADLTLPCDQRNGDVLVARVLARHGDTEISIVEGHRLSTVILVPASLRRLRDWLNAILPPDLR